MTVLASPTRRVQHWLLRVGARAWDRLARIVLWPLGRKRRMLILGWLIALFVLGNAAPSHADDGLFNSPYTGASGDQLTPFERYSVFDYDFLYAPDENNDGVEGIATDALDSIEGALFYLGASLIRGALIGMQWMLGLDLYKDNAGAIDASITTLANRLLIPMLGFTLVIAGFSAYARAKRHGGGSIFNDTLWIVAGTIFALGFSLFPSTVVGLADGARGALGSLVMTSYAAAADQGGNSLGVANGSNLVGNMNCGQTSGGCEDLTGANGARFLANSLWDAWVNTPWCTAQFRQVATCAKPDDRRNGLSNAAVLLDPDQRAELVKDLNDHFEEVNEGGKYPAWGGNDRWIRGMLGGRIGVVLVFLIVSVPVALLLLGLTLIGLLAVVGLLLLVVVGPFFLALLPIPGAPRHIAMQWLHSLIAVLMQGVLITLILGTVAIISGIINENAGEYGYFMAAVFNIVVLMMAWKLRAQLEGFATAGGGSLAMSSGAGLSSYSAWRLMGGASRAAKKVAGGTMSGIGRIGSVADRMSGGSGRGPGRGPGTSQGRLAALAGAAREGLSGGADPDRGKNPTQRATGGGTSSPSPNDAATTTQTASTPSTKTTQAPPTPNNAAPPTPSTKTTQAPPTPNNAAPPTPNNAAPPTPSPSTRSASTALAERSPQSTTAPGRRPVNRHVAPPPSPEGSRGRGARPSAVTEHHRRADQFAGAIQVAPTRRRRRGKRK